MQTLSVVIFIKVIATIFLWFIPLLFFPIAWLEFIGFRSLGIPIFLRLLGMAYGSLIVGYCFGLADCRTGIYPRSAVWMGIASNGGAFLLLLVGAFQNTWNEWGPLARMIMWLSLAATFLICAGLTIFGPLGRKA